MPLKPYPKYKTSNLDWLGNIPIAWNTHRLKFIAPIQNARTEKQSVDLNYLALEHIESKTGRILEISNTLEVDSVVSLFQKDDILFGKLRPYLAKVVHANFEGACTSELLVFRPIPSIVPRYLFYFLLSEPVINIANSFAYGTKMPRVNWDQIANLPVPIASIAEQQAIANFLDRETAVIDTLITKKRELIKRLQEKRIALISHAVTKGLDPTAPMKDSGVEWLGEIPAHWMVKRLKFFSEIVLGKMLTTEDKGRYFLKPYLRAKNLNWLIVDVNDVKEMWFSERELVLYRLKKDDLLVSEGGEVGRTCIWDNELDECYIQNSVNRVRLNPQNQPRYFLYQLYVAGQKGHFNAIVNQVSIAHLTKEKLAEVAFANPPLIEQQAIANFLDQETSAIDTLIGKVKKAINRLKEYRTALISAAVTGKIDVRSHTQGGS